METGQKGRKEGQVSSITLFIFINLFPVKETVHLQLFYMSVNMKPKSFLPETEEGGGRNGMAY